MNPTLLLFNILNFICSVGIPIGLIGGGILAINYPWALWGIVFGLILIPVYIYTNTKLYNNIKY